MGRYSINHRCIPSILCVVAMLGSIQAAAESPDTHMQQGPGRCCAEIAPARAASWRADSRFYLTWRSNYVKSRGDAARTGSLAAGGRFDFASAARPYKAGISIEYRHVSNRRDAVYASGYVTYKTSAWLLASGVICAKPLGSPSRWLYAGSVLYRLAPRHGLGVEVRGALAGPDSSKRLLVYYAAISDALSLSLAVGAVSSGSPGRTALGSITWRFQ